MKLTSRWWWFLAFTAGFAVLAGFVFWGTWSPSVAPLAIIGGCGCRPSLWSGKN